jgi:agmatine deiminase
VPTPRDLGYRMPAEWERHEATWLAWPHDPITWPGRVEKVEQFYVQMIGALSKVERVDLLVRDAGMADRVNRILAKKRIKNVVVHTIPTADSWIRDYGPNFVKRRQKNKVEVAINRWIFNAWGGKYDALLRDDGIPERLVTLGHLPMFKPGMVLEGGAIDVNGAGAVLTTEQCLLNKNRNPQLTRAQIEARLRDFLGVDQVLWLKEGIEGDDTDGHIDDIARFIDPQTIMAAVEPDKKDANHKVLRQNLKDLRSMKDLHGRPFDIIEMPMPGRVESDEGRLPASYMNFYIANDVVLMPTFGDPHDEQALRILEQAMPSRKVVPLRCEDVVWGMGTIHCLSQQQPAPV